MSTAALPVGDPVGFARLIDAHQSMVCSIALSIVRDVQTSEDVAQEVFVAAWQQLGKLRNPASLVPWLRQVTRNRANDRLRAKPVVALPDEPVGHDDLEAAALATERDQIVQQVLDTLPDDSREVILLYYREGRSVRQVAQLLDLSETAVKQRMSRARKRMREGVAARFADAVRETAPNAAFTALVAAGLSVGGPSVAAASVASKTTATAAGAKTGLLTSALLGPLLGIAGVVVGTERAMAGARSEDERRALRTTGWVAAAHVTVLAAVVAWIPREPVWMWGWFATLATGFVLIYRVWVPRIIAPRWTAERASDPTAARRQRRQTIASWAGLGIGLICGGLAIALAIHAG